MLPHEKGPALLEQGCVCVCVGGQRGVRTGISIFKSTLLEPFDLSHLSGAGTSKSIHEDRTVAPHEQSGKASANSQGQTRSLILESRGVRPPGNRTIADSSPLLPHHLLLLTGSYPTWGWLPFFAGSISPLSRFLVLSAFLFHPTTTTAPSALRKGHRTTTYTLV